MKGGMMRLEQNDQRYLAWPIRYELILWYVCWYVCVCVHVYAYVPLCASVCGGQWLISFLLSFY